MANRGVMAASSPQVIGGGGNSSDTYIILDSQCSISRDLHFTNLNQQPPTPYSVILRRHLDGGGSLWLLAQVLENVGF